mgnify:CR=1 FL=1
MDNMVKKFRLGELFCGPGGLALGAIQARISDPDYRIVHEWANDYDLDTCNTYRRNICPDDRESVVHGDVRELDIDSLGEIDAFAFGFPCNDFSVVGEQKGFAGTYGPLYTYGVKVLKRYKPLWFMAENVGGLKSANEGKAFECIKKDLIDAGYRIYPNLYKFEEYGVPQARHRMIIVGIREDLPYDYKVPSTEKYRNVDVTCCKIDKRKNTSYLSNNCKYDVFYNYVKILNLMTLHLWGFFFYRDTYMIPVLIVPQILMSTKKKLSKQQQSFSLQIICWKHVEIALFNTLARPVSWAIL